MQRRHQRLRDEYLNPQNNANNEVQDSIRRYRNPLFSAGDKRGIPKAVPTEELHDLDMDKYDKNPKRVLAAQEESPDLNDITDYYPQPKKNNKKNINLQLSQTLLDEPEVIV